MWITDKLNIKKRKMRSVYLSLKNIQTICQQLVFKQYYLSYKRPIVSLRD